jgi:sigma-B regulation protein RsbU (phosphoserine phosphatase)
MIAPPLLLAQISLALSRSDLRWYFAYTAAGLILLFIGLVAAGLYLFRRNTRDLTLASFATFCILYALRLLVALPPIQALFTAPPALWTHIDRAITYVILVPLTLVLSQVVQGQLKTFLRYLLAVQATFAIVAVLGDLLRIAPVALSLANNIVVISSIVTLPVFLIATRTRAAAGQRFSREIGVFFAGLAVWWVFVLYENLETLRHTNHHNIEWVGFLIFIGCLGYIATVRTFANEERLLAINKELQIARQIQSSTLPREVPKLAGLDIAARYVPMSAVAGDFYDFLVVDDHRIGVLVADVTGHGVPAALIASMLKVAFAGQSAHVDDPARLLAGLNRALCGKFEDHFVTAAYVFLDMNSRVLRYAGAGHPPLMLASRSSGVRQIEENGLMLGLFPEADYTAKEIPLNTGDRCLLYTDGILEAMNASQEEFGKARLQQSLEAHRNLSAAQFTGALLEEISRWSGHTAGRRQEDDITLVALDFSEEPG